MTKCDSHIWLSVTHIYDSVWLTYMTKCDSHIWLVICVTYMTCVTCDSHTWLSVTCSWRVWLTYMTNDLWLTYMTSHMCHIYDIYDLCDVWLTYMTKCDSHIWLSVTCSWSPSQVAHIIYVTYMTCVTCGHDLLMVMKLSHEHHTSHQSYMWL